VPKRKIEKVVSVVANRKPTIGERRLQIMSVEIDIAAPRRRFHAFGVVMSYKRESAAGTVSVSIRKGILSANITPLFQKLIGSHMAKSSRSRKITMNTLMKNLFDFVSSKR
jgi:hypothetical protein